MVYQEKGKDEPQKKEGKKERKKKERRQKKRKKERKNDMGELGASSKIQLQQPEFSYFHFRDE